MPDSMSIERRRLLSALGAELVLTPSSEGMAGSIREAKRIAAARGGFIPDQFSNPAGPAAHYKTTGPELWHACDGNIDAFVCAVGTGGTITGTGHYLKEQNPAIQIFAVEPADSPVLSGGKVRSRINYRELVPDLCRTHWILRCMSASLPYKRRRHTMLRALPHVRMVVLAGISSGAALHAVSVIAPQFAGKTVARTASRYG